MSSVVTCGHKVSVAAYDVVADPKSVIAWYHDRLAGATAIDLSDATGDVKSTNIEMIAADGSGAVFVSKMNFDNEKLAAAAKTLHADATTIGLNTFEPPLPADEIAIMAAATGSDPAAKAAAKAKFQTMCPNG